MIKYKYVFNILNMYAQKRRPQKELKYEHLI